MEGARPCTSAGPIPEGRGFRANIPTSESTPARGVRLPVVPTTVEVEVELDDEAVLHGDKARRDAISSLNLPSSRT
jgi:hypothetical protein